MHPFRTPAAALVAAAAVVSIVSAPAARGAGSAEGGRASGRPVSTAQLTRTVRAMSDEQKVGQLFVTYAYGSSADTPDQRNAKEFGVRTPAEVVAKYHLGGVIYFDWTDSVAAPPQIAHLSNGLQRAALGSGARVPLLISTDQEYGTVTRIGPPATQFPGGMALGAARSPGAARQAGGIAGTELKAMGVNQDFAPDADVNVNPANPVIGVRSFSADPALAARLTAAQVKGYQRDGGIVAAAKHFPGHGDTATDSHTGIPVITHTKEQWEKTDAPPFRAAVKAGIGVVMTAHLVMPALDPSRKPATLSKPILTGLLRKELGYRGVVITDSLQMAGVRQEYGDDRIPVMALNAGADMLLMPQHMDVAYRAVLAAVRSGEVPRARLDEAVTRILRLKEERGILAHPLVDEGRVGAEVGSPAHLRRAQRITDRTTTLVRNDAGTVPFRSAPRSMAVIGTASGNAVDGLSAAAGARGTAVDPAVEGAKPTDAAIADAVARARRADAAVVLTYKAANASYDPDRRQAKLVEAVRATGRPVVVAAVNDPYDLGAFDRAAPTYLATYSSTGVAMASLARVLYGEVRPAGRLPVPIPSLDRPGTELYGIGHGLTGR